MNTLAKPSIFLFSPQLEMNAKAWFAESFTKSDLDDIVKAVSDLPDLLGGSYYRPIKPHEREVLLRQDEVRALTNTKDKTKGK